MRSSVSVGVAAGILLVLTIAAPAHADTITTSTVTATTAGDVTNPPYISSLIPLLPPGPVTFPLAVTAGSFGSPASTLSPGLPAAGCTRLVNSFAIAFSTPTLTVASEVQLGNYVNGAFVSASNFTYSGDGVASQPSLGVLVAELPASGTPQAGLLTLTYPTPVPIADMYQIVVMREGVWSIDSADFSVTDTCPDAAGGPTLAASGLDSGPLLAVAGTLLAGGLLALAAVRRRGAVARRKPASARSA